jgi:glycosyltransferase involved in cell wall biosynthesis
MKEISKDFDLVHIHANYNFVNLKDITELANQIPTIITLHDQRFFTGGCHYSYECEGFTGDCKNCPQVRSIFNILPEKSLNESVQAFEKMLNLEVIAPSKWISELALKSRVLGKKKIWTVSNPVPDVFKPKQFLGTAKDSLRVGFISQDLNNPYKGLDILLRAISKIEELIQIEVRLFGHGKISPQEIKSRVIFSQFENDEQASIAYNSCDLIVVPSRQDNFPSVVTEALSCGVPVIGSNIGGISEVLDAFGLPKFQSGDVDELAKLILEFNVLETKVDYAAQAASNFSFKESARRHHFIYSKLVE